MRARVITAGVLAPTVLAILFLSSPWPLAALGLICSALCAIELAGLLQVSSNFRPLAFLGFPAFACAVSVSRPSPASACILAACAAAGVGYTYLSASGKLRNLAIDDLASLWYSAPLAACIVLHGQESSVGAWSFKSPLLLALLPVWAGDVAGILVGKRFGKHLLAPSLSPKKTVEGSVANLIAAGVAGAAFGPLIGLSFPTSIACGIVAGVLGQLGDLFESYVKRRADKKDSGTILPGHGGILDRIDSLLFTAPAVMLILTWFR